MIKAIVTDIEGTTSSISFVKEVLFPYAQTHIAEFVRQHQDEAQVKTLLQDVRDTVAAQLTLDQVIAQLLTWIDEDKKVTPLKALQGLIWEEGYHLGAFVGHIYPDVIDNLRAWKASGIDLYVYSSGSVHAQKLLFGHTGHGDLTPLFSGYFDTRIGAKQESVAYSQIAGQIGSSPTNILFLSDIKAELDAARSAGFQTLWLIREGLIDPSAEHRQVADFDQIGDLNG
ncbi:Enolase-phosphatase E1 [Crenothrix polyspora]|uniref:Enolase-phosphatase E1 n=1 Tax=Crenothrix polyspora TaxID=360316 RepID=A0A1R4H9D2_9GAMM|nr:acireductone synthase [Crenothrix polyspora]SJM92777.1 Enolase-phosphatase E1 [Crenothrix polyspora]